MSYELFLSPGKIGTLELKNRSVFPPMGSGYCEGGLVNDRLIRYHARRAEGGCALNIVEIAPVHKTTITNANPNLYDDSFIPGFQKLADAIHQAGGKACVQLWHGGRQTSGKPFGGKPFAPSAITCPFIGEEPHAMTLDEIWEVIGAFGDAAVRAQKAGFDCVELHGAHGYLIDSFLNEYTNQRDDEFGGSLENRARFGVEVIKDVRKKVGSDFPIIMRMVAFEHAKVPGGIMIEESIEAAKLFKQAGIDALDISQGSYSTISYTVPPYFYPLQLNAQNAGRFRKEVQLPVICAGRMPTPDLAEEVLQKGLADFISLGRPQLTDPDFVKKTMEGNVDDIVHCIACNQGCVERLFMTPDGVSCIFTPTTGYENVVTIEPAKQKKKVLVIGGGPAGMEGARVAANRGHDVTLFEKSGKMGGQYLLAAVAPHKDHLADSMWQMAMRAAKAGVDIRLFTTATKERIQALNPDFVLLATGATACHPPLKGIEHAQCAWKVIAREAFVPTDDVVIIGGGLAAMEAMELLARDGKKVTIIEMQDEIAKDLEFYIKPYTFGIVDEFDVTVHVNTKCIEIDKGHVVVEKDGERQTIECGTVVYATGAASNNNAEPIVKELGIDYAVVGDADHPGKVMAAIWSANEVARSI